MNQLDKLIDAILERSKGRIALPNLDLLLVEALILVKAEIDALKKEIRNKHE